MLTLRQHVADFTLAEISNAPSVLDAAEALARHYDFAKHPYFVWARASTTRLEEFRASQEPYLQCVEQFSRSLAVVLGRTSLMEQRLATVYENVAEEHGYGRLDGSHRHTFAEYLRVIGVRDEAFHRAHPPRFLVAAQTLLDFCLANPVEMGAAATGIVEYTHIKIARLLAHTIHERFWGDLDAQRHYRLHAEIDADHALSLFALCHDGWKEPRTRERIAFAMAFSVHVWWSEFEALLPAEKIAASETDGIRRLLDAEGAKDASRDMDAGRVSCDLSIRVRPVDGTWHVVGATEIGENGIAVIGLGELPVDAEVEVSFETQSPATPPVLGCIRSKPNAKGERCVEFMVDEARRAHIREFMRVTVQAAPAASGDGVHNTEVSTKGFDKPAVGRCDHVGIRVTDALRAQAFYELFGFRLDPEDTWEEHRALGLVNDAGFRINLIYNADARASKGNVLLDEPQKWTGITHLALSVDNLDNMMRYLAHQGIEITEGPLLLGNQRKICFIRDPDNNVIEFTERWLPQHREQRSVVQ